MLSSTRAHPGHPEPAPPPNTQPLGGGGPSIPATPLRCQASDRLVALTTTSVLSVPRQHKELVVAPLGALLSPTPSKSLPTYTLDPATCTNCGAYINVYAPAAGHLGEWHCNFCLHFNSGGGAPSSAAGEAAADQQQQQQAGGQPAGQHPPNSYITPPATSSLGPAAGGSGGLPSTPLTPLQPPLMQEAVDYISPSSPGPGGGGPTSGASTPGSWGLPIARAGSSSGEGVAVLVVDLMAAPADLRTVKAALLKAAAAMPGAARVALVACSTSLLAYRLGGQPTEAGVAADVLPGDIHGGEAALLRVLRPGVHVAPVAHSRPALLAAIQSLRAHPASRPPQPRSIPGAVEAALRLCQLAQDEAAQRGQHAEQAQQQQQQHGDPKQQLALGSPLRLGGPRPQLMERESNRPPGHIVIVTTGRALLGYSPLSPSQQQQQQQQAAGAEARGEPEAGEEEGAGAPGAAALRAAQEMNTLANRAALQGVTIDILASGADPDHIPAVSPLAQGTAGLFVQHRLCDESFAGNIVSAVRRPAGLTASLEVRTSSGLAVRDTYGAVVPLFAAGRETEQWQALTGGAAPPPPRWLNRRTWHYRCGPPSDSAGVTLVLHCDKPPAQTYVYIQVVWSWVDEGGHRVQRIVTRRLSTTHNPTAVVEAMDPGVAGLVWAKTIVAQALERGAAFDRKETEILRRSLGKALFEFVSRFGLPVESSRGWFSGPSRFVLPAALLPIAQTLYCLHRGPMLHWALPGHPEERALLQAHFMTASLQLSTLMVTPALHLLAHLPPPPHDGAGPSAGGAPAEPANGSLLGGHPAAYQQQTQQQLQLGEYSAAAAAAGLPPSPSRIRTTSSEGHQDPQQQGPSGGSSGSGSAWRAAFVGAPAVDMALHDCPAALLDHGSHMVVWLNPALDAVERAAGEALCRRYALELGADRVPVPEVVMDSGACLARLTPIRRDPHRQQLRQAPMLAAVSRGLLERAAKALGPSEEASFYSWLAEHGVQPPQEG